MGSLTRLLAAALLSLQSEWESHWLPAEGDGGKRVQLAHGLAVGGPGALRGLSLPDPTPLIARALSEDGGDILSTDDVISEEVHAEMEHFIDSKEAHGIAAVFSVIAVVISIHLIWMHLVWYSRPLLQRQIVRIITIVPVYAICSALSLTFEHYAVYINTARDVYEAYCIHCFLALMLDFPGGEPAVVEGIKEHQKGKGKKGIMAHPKPFCCCPNMRLGVDFIVAMKRTTLQFVILKPLMAVLSLVFMAADVFDTPGAQWFLLVVYNLSYTTALYGLLLFYMATKTLLKGFSPVGKFGAVKIIVFATYYQSLIVVAIPGMDSLGSSERWNDFIICFEMALFAIMHEFAFSHKEFMPGGVGVRDLAAMGFEEPVNLRLDTSAQAAYLRLFDVFNIRDTWEDLKRNFSLNAGSHIMLGVEGGILSDGTAQRLDDEGPDEASRAARVKAMGFGPDGGERGLNEVEVKGEKEDEEGKAANDGEAAGKGKAKSGFAAGLDKMGLGFVSGMMGGVGSVVSKQRTGSNMSGDEGRAGAEAGGASTDFNSGFDSIGFGSEGGEGGGGAGDVAAEEAYKQVMAAATTKTAAAATAAAVVAASTKPATTTGKDGKKDGGDGGKEASGSATAASSSSGGGVAGHPAAHDPAPMSKTKAAAALVEASAAAAAELLKKMKEQKAAGGGGAKKQAAPPAAAAPAPKPPAAPAAAVAVFAGASEAEEVTAEVGSAALVVTPMETGAHASAPSASGEGAQHESIVAAASHNKDLSARQKASLARQGSLRVDASKVHAPPTPARLPTIIDTSVNMEWDAAEGSFGGEGQAAGSSATGWDAAATFSTDNGGGAAANPGEVGWEGATDESSLQAAEGAPRARAASGEVQQPAGHAAAPVAAVADDWGVESASFGAEAASATTAASDAGTGGEWGVEAEFAGSSGAAQHAAAATPSKSVPAAAGSDASGFDSWDADMPAFASPSALAPSPKKAPAATPADAPSVTAVAPADDGWGAGEFDFR